MLISRPFALRTRHTQTGTDFCLRDQIKQFCLKGMNVFARARLAAAKPLAKTGLPGKRVNPVCVGLRLNNIY